MLFNLLQADSLIAAADVAEAMNTVADTVAAAPQQQEMSYSLISMAAKGGFLMIVLLVLSVIAIYLFGKKWWMIHQAGKIDRHFMDDIRDYIHEGKLKSAVTLCTKYNSPVARLVQLSLIHI